MQTRRAPGTRLQLERVTRPQRRPHLPQQRGMLRRLRPWVLKPSRLRRLLRAGLRRFDERSCLLGLLQIWLRLLPLLVLLVPSSEN